MIANDVRSDFRDDGPVLAQLLRSRGSEVKGAIVELLLVDYAGALGAERPTWVAAPLMTLSRSR